MLFSPKTLLLYIAVIFFFSSCANVVPLEGGDKDVTAPKIDSLRSTRNFQTKFQKQPINLTFDEWIALDNPAQVVVSPPLEKKPTITLKGKTVKLKFDDNETLRANTTYVINFGESIEDITQKNKAKIRYVFSTGDKIDSLTARFTVTDAISNAPVEKVYVMLYDNLSDSVVTKERPLYFGTTDKNGTCTIENLRSGTFKVFVLSDANLNYKYDLPNEKIGFLPQPITIQKDSSTNLKVTFFEPQLPLSIKEKNADTYGRIKLAFNQNAKSVAPTWQNIGQTTYLEYFNDSLLVWYHQPTTEQWKLFALKDTINVNPAKKDIFLQKAALRLQGAAVATSNKRFKSTNTAPTPNAIIDEKVIVGQALTLNFVHPIQTIDIAQITIVDDSTKQILNKSKATIDTTSKRKIHLYGDWKENHTYRLLLMPNAVEDIFGLKNDSIQVKLKVTPKKDLGEIVLKYGGLEKTQQYILQLWNSNSQLIAEKTIKNSTEGQFSFPLMTAGVYEVKIITDENKNGHWDSGNYYEKRLPELIFSKKLEDLKPNWTLEASVDIKGGKEKLRTK